MTEGKPKEPKETEEKEQATSFKIDIAGLEKLEDAERESIEKALQSRDKVIEKLSNEINKIKESTSEEINKIKQEKENAEKQVLLDKLEAANYSTEHFKDLSKEALLKVVKGLSQKDGRIIIPKPDEKTDTEPDRPPTIVYDPNKGYIDFWTKKPIDKKDSD